MIPEAVGLAVLEAVNQLALGNYDALVDRCTKSRLTGGDLRRVISNYGRKLVPPPSGAYRDLDAIRVESAVVPTWSVRAALWTEEEGRSDLTLELTVSFEGNETTMELDDLHVL